MGDGGWSTDRICRHQPKNCHLYGPVGPQKLLLNHSFCSLNPQNDPTDDADSIKLSTGPQERDELVNQKVLVGAAGAMVGGIVMAAILKIHNSMRDTSEAVYENLEA